MKFYLIFVFFFVSTSASVFENLFLPTSEIWGNVPPEDRKMLIHRENFFVYHFFSHYIYPSESRELFEIKYYWMKELSQKQIVQEQYFHSTQNDLIFHINIACYGDMADNCIDKVIKLKHEFEKRRILRKYQIVVVVDTKKLLNTPQLHNIEMHFVKYINNGVQKHFHTNGINLPFMLIDRFIENFQRLSPLDWASSKTILMSNNLFFIPIGVHKDFYIEFVDYLHQFKLDVRKMATIYKEMDIFFRDLAQNVQYELYPIGFNGLVFKIIEEAQYNENCVIIHFIRFSSKFEEIIRKLSSTMFERLVFGEYDQFLEFKNWHSEISKTIFHSNHISAYQTHNIRIKDLFIGVVWNHNKFKMEIELMLKSAAPYFENHQLREFIILVPTDEVEEMQTQFAHFPVQIKGFEVPSSGMNNNNRFLFISKFLATAQTYKKIIVSDLTDIVFQNDPFHLLPHDNYFLIGNMIEEKTKFGKVVNKQGSEFFGQTTGYSISIVKKLCAGTIAGDYFSILLLGYLINEYSNEAKYNQMYWIYMGSFQKKAYKIVSYPNGFLFYRIGFLSDKCNWQVENDTIILNENNTIPAIIHQTDIFSKIQEESCWKNLIQYDKFKPFFKV